jgi:SSS family solute:Na+ symporter
MLDLISLAYFFVTQLLPALFGVLFVRQFSALGITAGLIVGNAVVLLLHFSQADIGGINLGLIALLANLLVTIAVSVVAKNRSSLAPVAESRRSETRQAEGSTV